MNAGEIASILAGRRAQRCADGGWLTCCPLSTHGRGRGDRSPSLTLRDGHSKLLVKCFAGCAAIDILAELRRRGLLAGSVTNYPPRASLLLHRRDAGREDDARRIAWPQQIWDATLPPAGTAVVPYFADLGIAMPPSPSPRWAPVLRRPDGTYGPAMVARVDAADGRLIGVHRTWLARDSNGAWRRRDRASLGPIGGGAVRFGIPREGEWLAIGEGLETTLAVVTACAMPGWAALSAGGIRALILPPEATHVVICADHDTNGVGQRASDDAAARWRAEGRRVRIALPPEPDTDFADLLAADPSATAEARHVA